MKRPLPLLAFFVAVAAIAFLFVNYARENPFPQKHNNPFPPPPDKTAANQYYLSKFKPRYRRSDCIVRLDFSYYGDPSFEWSSLIFREFSYYLFENDPKAAIFSYRIPARGRAKAIFLQFADQCDRRFEIADALAAHLVSRHPVFEMTASHDLIAPGPNSIEVGGEGYWIDSRLN